MGKKRELHSLIPLGDFKAVLGIDDREDTLSRYCLITATYTIEQHCKRRLVRRKNTDYLTFTGEPVFTLREYPVRRVLAVWAAKVGAAIRGEPLFSPENLICPKHYYCLPGEGNQEDIPFSLVLRPPRGLDNFFANEALTEPHAVLNYPQTRSPVRVPPWAWLAREEMGIRVRYAAGYGCGEAPADLASACLELAAWNMARYRGQRIGMTGVVRGNGKDGEHLEASMPENVRQLLEPYRRRML